VRADIIKTDTNGLNVGDAKVKVSDGEMPVYRLEPDAGVVQENTRCWADRLMTSGDLSGSR
jgi:hypothetical protein